MKIEIKITDYAHNLFVTYIIPKIKFVNEFVFHPEYIDVRYLIGHHKKISSVSKIRQFNRLMRKIKTIRKEIDKL